MRYAALLVSLGLASWYLAATNSNPRIILHWLSLNWIVLGLAHAIGYHHLFGKSASGRLSLLGLVLFLPFLVLTYLVWRLVMLVQRDAAANDVNPQLTVGRRPLPGEVIGEFANYVDLTAEFNESSTLRNRPGYLCIPILDGSALRPDELRAALVRLQPGRTFIHCAQGYGRTGFFAVALALERGWAGSVEEALQMLRAARRKVHLNSVERRMIAEFTRMAAFPKQAAES